jgi:hypothetical protein
MKHLFLLVALFAFATPVRAQCVGDCNGDGVVQVPELVTMVDSALGTEALTACVTGCDDGGPPLGVPITCIIEAMNNALYDGCGDPTPTATPTFAQQCGVGCSGSCYFGEAGACSCGDANNCVEFLHCGTHQGVDLCYNAPQYAACLQQLCPEAMPTP